MKKTYINPTIKVVKIETRSIIAASGETVGINSEAVSAESAESRSSSFGFGDEE